MAFGDWLGKKLGDVVSGVQNGVNEFKREVRRGERADHLARHRQNMRDMALNREMRAELRLTEQLMTNQETAPLFSAYYKDNDPGAMFWYAEQLRAANLWNRSLEVYREAAKKGSSDAAAFLQQHEREMQALAYRQIGPM